MFPVVFIFIEATKQVDGLILLLALIHYPQLLLCKRHFTTAHRFSMSHKARPQLVKSLCMGEHKFLHSQLFELDCLSLDGGIVASIVSWEPIGVWGTEITTRLVIRGSHLAINRSIQALQLLVQIFSEFGSLHSWGAHTTKTLFGIPWLILYVVAMFQHAKFFSRIDETFNFWRILFYIHLLCVLEILQLLCEGYNRAGIWYHLLSSANIFMRSWSCFVIGTKRWISVQVFE